MNTPVLLLVFNRPDLLLKLISSIEKVRPKYLYLACDGPRNDVDRSKIDEIKKIIQEISWKPTLRTLFRESNLTTYKAIPSALDWFFEHENEGIILEDDCIPDLTFFKFCEENLEKYRENSKVLTISGNNVQNKIFGDGSYYFSHVPHIWGWATWKRAWNLFDFEMKTYPDFKKNNPLSLFFKDKKVQKRLLQMFQRAYDGQNIWDFKLTYMHFLHDGYSIIPNNNLVTNIGFDERATHPLMSSDPLANLKVTPLEHIVHNEIIIDYIESYTQLGLTIFKPNSFKDIIVKSLLYLRKWVLRLLS